MADALTEDVATYLQAEQRDTAEAVNQFQDMTDRYRYRSFPRNRVEFLPAGQRSRGTLVARPALDALATARNEYEEGSEEYETVNTALNDWYFVAGSMERDVYSDGMSVWIEEDDALTEATAVEEAIPLRTMVETYGLMRDAGDLLSAKEQLDTVNDLFLTGYLGPDQELRVYHDPRNHQTYTLDTRTIELNEIDQSLGDLISWADYRDADDADLVEDLFDPWDSDT